MYLERQPVDQSVNNTAMLPYLSTPFDRIDLQKIYEKIYFHAKLLAWVSVHVKIILIIQLCTIKLIILNKYVNLTVN